MSTESIQVSTAIKSSIENVWHAYTSPDAIVKWNAASDDWHTTAATVDLRKGGQSILENFRKYVESSASKN